MPGQRPRSKRGSIEEVWPYHDKVHILWEWWTAENSDGFHNLTLQGIVGSVDQCVSRGNQTLGKAIEEKKK